jgi:hypothetical protein
LESKDEPPIELCIPNKQGVPHIEPAFPEEVLQVADLQNILEISDKLQKFTQIKAPVEIKEDDDEGDGEVKEYKCNVTNVTEAKNLSDKDPSTKLLHVFYPDKCIEGGKYKDRYLCNQ